MRQDDLSRILADAILRRGQNWSHSVRTILISALLLKGIGESWVAKPVLLMSCQVVDDLMLVSLVLHKYFVVCCGSIESIFYLLLSNHTQVIAKLDLAHFLHR